MSELIPKIIHYCWFGRNPKSRLIKKCIKSWIKYCPDYQIVEWTEDNFDLNNSPLYVQQAYEARKWAFVSDYVRFYALTEYGGIYLDTDIQLLRSLDSFLSHQAFTGTEDGEHISAGIMGCVKGYSLFREFLLDYRNKQFLREDGSFDTNATVVTMLTKKCIGKGYQSLNKYQEVSGLAIYPIDYFYPLSIVDGVMRKTQNTVSIHWFAGSWVPKELKRDVKIAQIKRRIKYRLISIIGENGFAKIKQLLTR